MCYLTVTEDGEEVPVCNHGISTTIAVILKAGKCPYEDEAMDCFVLCKSKIRDFQNWHREKIKILDTKTKRYHKLNKTSKYRVDIKPGNYSSTFNFLDLCKSM